MVRDLRTAAMGLNGMEWKVRSVGYVLIPGCECEEFVWGDGFVCDEWLFLDRWGGVGWGVGLVVTARYLFGTFKEYRSLGSWGLLLLRGVLE